MSCKSAKNDDTITKKCGEITITMKKNAKNVFSFNCWFCDTIYAQMKKFTLHLEKEHVDQLEQSTTKIPEYCNEDDFDDKIEMQKETALDSVFVPEIKIEDCENEDIKSEIGEETPQIVTRFRKREKSLKFEDPLETIESNDNEISLTEPQENAFEVETDMHLKNESQLEDEEMDNISEDEHSEDESDYSGEDISSDDDSKIENSTDEMLLKPLKPDKKAKEKELILALIEAYKQKPQLWNTPIAKKYNSKQKDELLKNIADDLNAKLNLKLKLYSVKTKLNVICKQYEKVIRKFMTNEGENVKQNEEDSSELWYYEHLSFLKPFTENKIKNKRTKSYHKVKPLSDSVLCEIIDIYKNYNSLWDVNHIAYMVRQKRNENMQLLLEDVKKNIDIPLNVDKLEKHLQYIHNSFSKDKQLKLECESKQKDFKPTCSFFNKCEFLEEHQAPFRCQHCSKDFTLYTDFRIHKSEHDGSCPFVCQECGKPFKLRASYILHIKRHLGVLRFCCKVCGKGYPLSAELDLHMRSHTGALPFLCSLCGERFRTAIGYDNHIRRHEERFRYCCHICKKGFNHLTLLNNHVKTHLNIRDFICTICGKGFTLKKYLLYHKTIHGGKNYTCNICGKSYAQTAGLRQHKKTHGNPTGISRMQRDKPLSDSVLCEIIDIYKHYNSLWDVNHIAYMVKQKRNENMQLLLEDIKKKIDIPLDVDKLKKHLQYIHNLFSKDKKLKLECELKQQDFKPTCSFFNKCEFLEQHQGPFRCPYCSKIFIPYKEFQIHKSQHDGSFPFICQKCGTGFKACGNYTIHVKRHLGVFRFCCKICGKGYPVNNELNLHMRSHTGAQPYLCSLCGEGFRTAMGYDNHIRRHENRFRYNCHICKKGFNILTFLNDHVRAHLNVRNIICTICGKGFTSKKYLAYHKRIHGSKNYTCNICGKSYAQDAGLRQHKKSHGTPIGANKIHKS